MELAPRSRAGTAAALTLLVSIPAGTAGAAPAWRFEPSGAPRSFVAGRLVPEATVAPDRVVPRGAGIPWLRLAASPDAAMAGQERLPGRVTRLGEPGRQDLPTFAAVRVLQAWPGIDVVHHARSGRLEHDFVVEPGASATRISLVLEGADRVHSLPDGGIAATGPGGTLTLEPPVAWQEGEAGREPVAVAYELRGRTLGFALGRRDEALRLVIDPVLGWSTWVGGSSASSSVEHALRADDGAILTYLVHGGLPATQGAWRTEGDPSETTMLACLEPDGESLRWATYLPPVDIAAIALTPDGSIVLAGTTGDPTLPATGFGPAGGRDGWVARISGDGRSLLGSCYVGSASDDRLRDVAVAQDGDILVTGATLETPSSSLGLVVRLSPNLSDERFRRVLGGSGRNDAMHVASQPPTDDVLVVFHATDEDFPTLNAFMPSPPPREPSPSCDRRSVVARLQGRTGAPMFVTWVAGECDDRLDVASDAAGAILLAGGSSSLRYPVLHPWQAGRSGDSSMHLLDGVVTRLDAMGWPLSSTYVGGPGVDAFGSVAIDRGGRVVASGWGAAGFPQHADYGLPEPDEAPGATYVAASRFDLNGRLTLSTLLGGDSSASGAPASRGLGLALDGTDILVTGLSNTADYPATGSSGLAGPPCCATDTDSHAGFVTRISSTVTTLGEPTARDQPLVVRHAGGGASVVLGWDETLGGGPGTRFGLYQGTLHALWSGRRYDHVVMASCSRDTQPATLPIPAEDSYFLLTQIKVADESSYGRDSFGRERPAAEAPCR